MPSPSPLLSPAPVAIDAAAVPSRRVRAVYPEPFARLFEGRDKKALGNAFNLTNFGVNLTRLAPGAISALRGYRSRSIVAASCSHPSAAR